MKTPGFWYRPRATPAAWLLASAGALYDAASRLRRAWVSPQRAPVPVVCIGNLVAGGAGKTPVALALGRRLAEIGITVHFLSRGHGGSLAGPVRVDRHSAAEVGDEPLLLARAAPAWISRDRPAGARAAAAAGARLILMDDGFQNPSLAKDLSLLVVDGGSGFGNGLILPAGPLRERPANGLKRADALVVMGPDRAGIGDLAARHGLPALGARLVPAAEDVARLRGRKVLAFAGIGRPEKFFATLAELGAEIVGAVPFPDHHAYTPDEVMRLVETAQERQAVPVTTEKDLVRLPPEARPMVEALRVELAWDDPAAVDAVLEPVVRRALRA
ncbi:tetraacyldisaccharide 4'-kinase [Inquilinus limosus]|uniref:Tetraacyldisaccharide 4'-kinase n=1 Tax=Inquilinus limosus TaxID=171674 RepID=A0A211ZQ17_9PROT|nr:tetraacyldisaccharide 4'-kinase [Inquilinus limosus]OWJ67372.1 tetraacyldisaccharide 4'-kinase [Inquilinus limosus]